ncbi:Protein ABHD11 like protein [Argiope bruennichi]|uniref:sn-1-specific diacylglycerol lipase ABHD11 n=1 Tax=Argiope bruennichi TaxID=94029 RepID=A0A8T0E913_ARGBR|nr:Protein ABHD11 like protein [Argiope bruennichi]
MRLAYDLHLPPGDIEKNLPPVILLHGMLDSRKTWKFIAPKIAKQTGRKVYAVDARNHGESPWSDEFTFDILAEDLDSFLTQHNIRKATLVGHSMGGRTSLTLSLKKPERVEKLVVEDMHTKNFRPTEKSPIMHLLRILRESIESIPSDMEEDEVKQAMMQFMEPLLGRNNNSKLARVKIDMSMLPLKKHNGTYAWQTNLNALETFLTTEKIRQHVQGIYLGDALFIYGTKSFFKVDKDPRILECFPRSIKLGIEGGSHLIHFEDPKRFVYEVTNFINGCSDVKSKY